MRLVFTALRTSQGLLIWCVRARVPGVSYFLMASRVQVEVLPIRLQRLLVNTALTEWHQATRAALERERADAAAALERERADAAAALARVSAAAELQRAVEVARERATTERERKKSFMRSVRAWAASAHESSTSDGLGADSARRGMVPPARDCALEEVLLAGFPQVEPATVATAWAAFKARASKFGHAAPAGERANVHPVLSALVEAAMGEECALRCWYEKAPHDAFPGRNMAPDFSFTARRDASLSTIAMLMLLEAKCKDDYASAMLSAANYARRTEAARIEDTDARGTGHLDRICTYAMGSDVQSIGIVRVSSGAPSDGCSFEDCEPHVMHESERLLLLGDAFTGGGLDASALPRVAPPGFVVLVRVLRAGERLISQFPLLQACDGRSLGRRLGSGGVSDVYELRGDDAACAKIPRFTSASIAAALENEERTLRAFGAANCAHVPRVIAAGLVRETVAPQAAWPYLVLSPVGVPFAAAASARCEVADPAAVRLGLSALAARGIIAALRVAHAAECAHCDVRPENVVLVEEEGGASIRVVLVDWAFSAPFGTSITGRGQELYTADRVQQQGTCGASAWVDLVGATWRAPWLHVSKRERWFKDNSSDPRVAAAATFITRTAALGARVSDGAYAELGRIFA
jgi:hypothetical protein